jgi:Gpi18-like mannosyltransferase
MYTMGIFWLSLMIYVSVVLENPALWIFLFALGLGVRMDLLLLAPLFIVWFWKRKKN